MNKKGELLCLNRARKDFIVFNFKTISHALK